MDIFGIFPKKLFQLKYRSQRKRKQQIGMSLMFIYILLLPVLTDKSCLSCSLLALLSLKAYLKLKQIQSQNKQINRELQHMIHSFTPRFPRLQTSPLCFRKQKNSSICIVTASGKEFPKKPQHFQLKRKSATMNNIVFSLPTGN